MSRLTTRMSIMGRKHDIEGGQAYHRKKKLKDYDYQLIEEAVDKLGELEDIEEEIGIGLITLHKALKNGVYIKKQRQTTFPLALFREDYSDNTTRYYVFNGKKIEIKLNEYGKTWALTKEELGK